MKPDINEMFTSAEIERAYNQLKVERVIKHRKKQFNEAQSQTAFVHYRWNGAEYKLEVPITDSIRQQVMDRIEQNAWNEHYQEMH